MLTSVALTTSAMYNPEEYCDMLTYVEEPSNMTVDSKTERDVLNRCKPAECHFIVPSAESSGGR